MAGTGGAKRRIKWAVLPILVAEIGYGVLKVASFGRGKPTISVNYAVEYNQKLRPANGAGRPRAATRSIGRSRNPEPGVRPGRGRFALASGSLRA